MLKSIYNRNFIGRSDFEKGACPTLGYEFPPSLTDQSYDYSIATKVESFIANGQAVQAVATKPGSVELPLESRIDSFYGDDLPVVQARVRELSSALEKRLESEILSEEEKSKVKRELDELRKIFSD